MKHNVGESRLGQLDAEVGIQAGGTTVDGVVHLGGVELAVLDECLGELN